MGVFLVALVSCGSITVKIPSFAHTLQSHGLALARLPLAILQVNVGKFCNQACHHCHVDASPRRTEKMTLATAERVLWLLEKSPSIHTVDITGGAPELNSNFRFLVESARALGRKVIDRCNLTVLFEPGQETTAAYFRDNEVQIIASLPCYTKTNTDSQRGRGVFEKSIDALRLLNEFGYGRAGSALQLDLVYNPGGAFLPGAQAGLEADYKRELKTQFDVEFHHLYTITNMPIRRFAEDLARSGKTQEYMELLVNSFNPSAALGVMCRNLISVGWDGQLYDCDFNQMLDITLARKPLSLASIESFSELAPEAIAFGDHCYGCTAGAGSSCAGALVG